MQTRTRAEGELKKLEDDFKTMPRWPAAIALLVVVAIFVMLSEEYIPGPRWLIGGVGVGLLAIQQLASFRKAFWWSRRLAFVLTGVLTLALGASAVVLVDSLVHGQTNAPALLSDAALIWGANVLVFALWFWQIDAGGPRHRRVGAHQSDDFLFPQMTRDDETSKRWTPGFVDYLFLAFTNSTAFSPTDTLPLSARAKLLMMCQALMSLVVVVVLAARAINTLPS